MKGKGQGAGARASEGRPDQEPEPPVADRADYDPSYDPGAPVDCEVCGGVMVYTAACKLKCPVCGYARDCSDP